MGLSGPSGAGTCSHELADGPVMGVGVEVARDFPRLFAVAHNLHPVAVRILRWWIDRIIDWRLLGHVDYLKFILAHALLHDRSTRYIIVAASIEDHLNDRSAAIGLAPIA